MKARHGNGFHIVQKTYRGYKSPKYENNPQFCVRKVEEQTGKQKKTYEQNDSERIRNGFSVAFVFISFRVVQNFPFSKRPNARTGENKRKHERTGHIDGKLCEKGERREREHFKEGLQKGKIELFRV